MFVGYVRVSTVDQTVTPKIDELKKAGTEKIFRDKISGATCDRPGLQEALVFLREGDSLVVWWLDRLGRSLKHLLETAGQLEEREIGFRSLQEAIDTTTSGGRLIFHIFGALAKFERNLIRERTLAGLKAARARGRKGGRPLMFNTKKAELAQRLYDERKHSIKDICQMFGISKPTLYAYVAQRNTSSRIGHDSSE